MVNLGYETDAEESAWGILAGRSIPKFNKFAVETPLGSKNFLDVPVGTSFTGIVKENPKSYQASDYETGELKVYKNNEPIMEVSIALDTDYREPEDEDDDGTRIARLGQQGKIALQNEMRRLGIKRFGIGTRLTMTFTGYGKSNGKGRPPKLYNIDLVPAEYVSTQQQGVDTVLSQAGYVEQAVQAGFPQGQPVQQVAQQPVQVAQQPVAVAQAPTAPAVDPVQALMAQAQATAQAAQQVQATAPAISILKQHTDEVNMLVGVGVDRATAIQTVAIKWAPGNEEFRAALDTETPI